MIHSEYYENYRGPSLTKATYNQVNDITEKIRNVYGKNNNWQGKLWMYKEIFGELDVDVSLVDTTKNTEEVGEDYHEDRGEEDFEDGGLDEDFDQVFEV